ncbi:MAG TPA: Mth938-like domain-containing protein [Xanthomonadaceae bacterium]|nr:Mth938-like domain-containing protein [Xanthomonadaceae bacterium]
MPLQYEAPHGHLYVRWVREDSIAVSDRTFTRSFLLTPEQAGDWQVAALSDLQDAALAPLFELAPELVILGTGPRQVFPSQHTLAAFLTRGIGVEVMDNGAAARTFNVLAAEGRRVVAAFLLG